MTSIAVLGMEHDSIHHMLEPTKKQKKFFI